MIMTSKCLFKKLITDRDTNDDTDQDEAMVMFEKFVNTSHTPHLDSHVIFVKLNRRQTSEQSTDTSLVCGWSDQTTLAFYWFICRHIWDTFIFLL